MLCRGVTRRDITALWFQPPQWGWFRVRFGITRHILVRSLGTAGPIRMVWEQVSPTARIPDGASASVTDMATILGTTHGGAQWRITDAVGIHITDGAHGVALPSPTCTGSGATQLIRVRAQPGRILTPGTTALRRAAPITIHKQAGARSLAGVTTPISTRGTLTDTAVAPPTTRTLVSSQAVELDMWATFTPGRARLGAAGSFTTPTRTQVLLRVRTTSMQAKTARCTVTTEIAVVGRPTAATAGNPSIGQNQGCKPNSKCAAKALSVIKTLTRCAASVALPRSEERRVGKECRSRWSPYH